MDAVVLRSGDAWSRLLHARLHPRHDVLGELERPDSHLWVALVEGDEVVAAHRALLAHDRVFLRGVFAFGATGFASGYTVARRLLSHAEDLGVTSSHVWVETTGRERRMAELLGARTSATPLHRYRIPVRGTLAGSGMRAGWVELPGSTERLAWMVDGRTTVLLRLEEGVVLPGRLPSEVATCLPEAVAVPTDRVEVALPASDLVAALHLPRRGAVRASRCPVLHGAVPPRTRVAA